MADQAPVLPAFDTVDSVKRETTRASVLLVGTMMGGILVVNSYIADWIWPDRPFYSAASAAVGAIVLALYVLDLVRRAVALLAAHHADIADDSPRLRYALECWTGLNRAATRRWLQGEATCQELITSTVEHVLRTFGAPPKQNRRTAPR